MDKTYYAIYVGGKTLTGKECGVLEGEMVQIKGSWEDGYRICKSNDGVNWSPVNHPEQYGLPSCQINCFESEEECEKFVSDCKQIQKIPTTPMSKKEKRQFRRMVNAFKPKSFIKRLIDLFI